MVRREVRAAREDHPWLSLDDGELLRAARLYSRDPATGERGFNLAAVMLLGRSMRACAATPRVPPRTWTSWSTSWPTH